ncbi:hypothetical protein DFH08DRAFT_815843 [Mycena albidolilacea]|uniref:Uncharacterized protein n=1 Tax=Mycena albidolilacea TaxID=1033008 RepID=A0AAD7EJZ0_9AGAR|nr:hypothetical protein DFH08DRAFT_815843 [Mycena albidolilacea]
MASIHTLCILCLFLSSLFLSSPGVICPEVTSLLAATAGHQWLLADAAVQYLASIYHWFPVDLTIYCWRTLSERPLEKKLVSELLDIAKAMNINTAKLHKRVDEKNGTGTHRLPFSVHEAAWAGKGLIGQRKYINTTGNPWKPVFVIQTVPHCGILRGEIKACRKFAVPSALSDLAHNPFFSIEEAPSWITSHGYQLFLTHYDLETATSWDLDDASTKQLKGYRSYMVSEYYRDLPFFSLENTEAWISLIPVRAFMGREHDTLPDSGPHSRSTSPASLPTRFIPFQCPSSPVLAIQPKSKKSSGKAKAKLQQLKITRELSVDAIEDIVVQSTWTVPRESIAYRVDCSHCMDLLATKTGKILSLDAFIQLQDQESWHGSTGKKKGDTWVSDLGPNPTEPIHCRSCHFICNGVNVCEFVNPELFARCERYKLDMEAMRELWNHELDANEKEAASVWGIMSQCMKYAMEEKALQSEWGLQWTVIDAELLTLKQGPLAGIRINGWRPGTGQEPTNSSSTTPIVLGDQPLSEGDGDPYFEISEVQPVSMPEGSKSNFGLHNPSFVATNSMVVASEATGMVNQMDLLPLFGDPGPAPLLEGYNANTANTWNVVADTALAADDDQLEYIGPAHHILNFLGISIGHPKNYLPSPPRVMLSPLPSEPEEPIPNAEGSDQMIPPRNIDLSFSEHNILVGKRQRTKSIHTANAAEARPTKKGLR